MGYCIIIVANIINIQLIDTCVTCCRLTPEKPNSIHETQYEKVATIESNTFHTRFGPKMSTDRVDKLLMEDGNYFHAM